MADQTDQAAVRPIADAAGDLRRDAAVAARRLGRGALGLLLCPLLAWPLATAVVQPSLAMRGLGVVGALATGFALYSGALVLFDARVFAAWSRAADPRAAMAAFDVRIGRSAVPLRSLPDRLAGAQGWLDRMRAGLLLQAGCVAAIVVLALLAPGASA